MYSQYQLQTPAKQPQITPSQGPKVGSAYSSPSRSHERSVAASAEPRRAVDAGDLHGTGFVGQPIQFSSGQFAGQSVRMELQEIQKADLGRKYARVDRRPLDPPPVIQLRLFSVQNAGTEREEEVEMNYDEVQVLGLVCTVDLFPVPNPETIINVQGFDRAARASFPTPSSPSTASDYSSQPRNNEPGHPSAPSSSDQYLAESPSQFNSTDLYTTTPLRTNTLRQPSHFSGHLLSTHPENDVVHHAHEYPITESSKQTQALVGATFVQPSVVDIYGRKAIVFVLSDLAVKIEGTFILRYRVFDIFSKSCGADPELTVTAETYGGVFRVYSTKEFPGLSASTELTKNLARWGVRLNIRETERRRRKRTISETRGTGSE